MSNLSIEDIPQDDTIVVATAFIHSELSSVSVSLPNLYHVEIWNVIISYL